MMHYYYSVNTDELMRLKMEICARQSQSLARMYTLLSLNFHHILIVVVDVVISLLAYNAGRFLFKF